MLRQENITKPRYLTLLVEVASPAFRVLTLMTEIAFQIAPRFSDKA